MLTRIAPAKINLALHVTGLRADGYHELDSLVTFAQLGDRLTFARSDELSLTLSGPHGASLTVDGDNLVLKAARALQCVVGAPQAGAAINLEKNLPIASGIGGGSADAAATLLGLRELWEVDVNDAKLSALGLSLGADVPMCLNGKPLRASGIGEILEPVSMPEFDCVLVNRMVPVSTPAVFNKLTHKNNPDLNLEENNADWHARIAANRNDLEPAACALVPDINTCLDALKSTSGCQLVRMSGSGATCFGLYDTQEDAQRAAGVLQSNHANWWVAATKTTAG